MKKEQEIYDRAWIAEARQVKDGMVTYFAHVAWSRKAAMQWLLDCSLTVKHNPETVRLSRVSKVTVIRGWS